MTDEKTNEKNQEKSENKGKKDTPRELEDKELDKVSGGAGPTPINGQVTDSVTQT